MELNEALGDSKRRAPLLQPGHVLRISCTVRTMGGLQQGGVERQVKWMSTMTRRPCMQAESLRASLSQHRQRRGQHPWRHG